MPDYPICDFCGLCEHCPAHGITGPECVHPCVACGDPVAFDQPGCMNRTCPGSFHELSLDVWQPFCGPCAETCGLWEGK